MFVPARAHGDAVDGISAIGCAGFVLGRLAALCRDGEALTEPISEMAGVAARVRWASGSASYINVSSTLYRRARKRRPVHGRRRGAGASERSRLFGLTTADEQAPCAPLRDASNEPLAQALSLA